MQTTKLPLQLNNINGANPAQRSGASQASGDAGQFSAMLTSELALAQAPAASPAAPAVQASGTPKQDAPKASQPAQQDDAADAPPAPAAAAQPAAKPTGSESGKQAGAADKSEDEDHDEGEAAAQKNADPANAMLALIASLQHPAAKAVAGADKGAAQAFDALGGRTRRSDASQLAALQGALKSAGKDGIDAKPIGAAAPKEGFAADLGAALGAGDKAAADLSGLLADSAAKAGGKHALEAADLGLQQARDAAQQTAQAQQDPSLMAAAALAQAAQPAALEAAQAAGASEQLSAQVGTDAWENQVGQKVVYMIGNEEQTASLTLNPPDLGPLQVVLSVNNDQASVTFSSNELEVRKALEDALPRLREMMSESGIALGNATVNAGNQEQQRQARQDGSPRGGRNYGAVDGVAATDTAAPRVARTTLLGDNGLVDTFA